MSDNQKQRHRSKRPSLFLTKPELRRLTGSDEPKRQVAYLVERGLNPWINPETGEPSIYRDVVMTNQLGTTNNPSDGFSMNLDGING